MVTAALCLLLAAAKADGSGDWLYSRMNGWIQMAGYTGDYDGYVGVDGLGGVTASDGYYLTVISKSASIWDAPKTNARKLASASHGESLLCIGRHNGEMFVPENGFYAVEYKGKQGYVNADYVVLGNLEITLLESNVPAYIAPDRNSKKVGSLSKLTSYKVIGFYDDFYIINLRGAAAAFIPMDVRHSDNTFNRYYHSGRALYEHAAALGKAKLRTGPGSDYPEVRTLKAGEKLTVVDVINDWSMILDEETGCYLFLEPGSVRH